jgi:glutamine synthetase
MVQIAKRDIYPSVCSYLKSLADVYLAKKSINISSVKDSTLVSVNILSALLDSLYTEIESLEEALLHSKDMKNNEELSFYCKDTIIPAMNRLRAVADELETQTASSFWPFPTYGQILYSV